MSQDLVGGPSHGASRSGDECRTLIGVHERCRFPQPLLIFGRDHQETMLVRVNQIAGSHLSTEDFHFTIPAHWVAETMSDTQAASERLEPGVIHLIQISNSSVGYGAHSSQHTMNVTVHFAPE